jgi:plasmid stabilization system protein ParE
MKVVFSSDFAADVAAQTQYLIAHGRREWAARLLDEIESLAESLEAHPELGAIEVHSPEIRKLILPRLPFVVRYTQDRRRKKIVVLRLFHARQKSAR